MATLHYRFQKVLRSYRASDVHSFVKKNRRSLQMHSILLICIVGSLSVFIVTRESNDRTCTPFGNEISGTYGPVTNLPLPRFVSLKVREANVRRGPSSSHRVDWVYSRRDLPLEVIAEYGHWRSVRDVDGMGGWVHYSWLSGLRSVFFSSPFSYIYKDPIGETTPLAAAEYGTVAGLAECRETRCLVSVEGIEGWVAKSDLWGIRMDELCR